uniref:Uncharacterized protein n=1 Tax=Chenopodium quinoa TaxID=63459 RepID=A0A803NB59_CHEQI
MEERERLKKTIIQSGFSSEFLDEIEGNRRVLGEVELVMSEQLNVTSVGCRSNWGCTLKQIMGSRSTPAASSSKQAEQIGAMEVLINTHDNNWEQGTLGGWPIQSIEVFHHVSCGVIMLACIRDSIEHFHTRKEVLIPRTWNSPGASLLIEDSHSVCNEKRDNLDGIAVLYCEVELNLNQIFDREYDKRRCYTGGIAFFCVVHYSCFNLATKPFWFRRGKYHEIDIHSDRRPSEGNDYAYIPRGIVTVHWNALGVDRPSIKSLFKTLYDNLKPWVIVITESRVNRNTLARVAGQLLGGYRVSGFAPRGSTGGAVVMWDGRLIPRFTDQQQLANVDILSVSFRMRDNN